MSKRIVINDPVYGLINIQNDILFDVVEHPHFQRLRRIRQLGLSHLVYPGATHTRFEHVLGATHLMTLAIEVLRSKGTEITEEEALGVTLAILLHDIGHGPFSHTMEKSFVRGISHEDFSVQFMNELNREFDGALTLCIEIFMDRYPKRFLHQLVSGQLDLDRLDYLGRDSFYSGVSEGVISAERIIKMLQLHNDQLVVEAKGIYSIENFLIARRLMYWQVYLHKTAIVSETVLTRILKRAKELTKAGETLFASPALAYFLGKDLTRANVYEEQTDPEQRPDYLLKQFAQLDDTDVICAIKTWIHHPDKVLSTLSSRLINRDLLKIEIRPERFTKEEVRDLKRKAADLLGITESEASYFVYTESVSNHAYSIKNDNINILYKDGSVVDISEASDMLNISVLSKNVKKHYLCYPKELFSTRDVKKGV